MSMIKRGKCSGSVKISSGVLVCNGCGYTEMADKETLAKECPKCNRHMVAISNDPIVGEDNNVDGCCSDDSM